MNAKMTITVPLDRINLKVSELLEEIVHSMEDAQILLTDISKDVYNNEDIMKQIDQLDSVRKQLALLDANVEDCYSVLVGLVNYRTGLNSKEAQNAGTQAE